MGRKRFLLVGFGMRPERGCARKASRSGRMIRKRQNLVACCGWSATQPRSNLFSPMPALPGRSESARGWRSLRRSALSDVHEPRASVLECGGPPPLFIYRSKCVNLFPGGRRRVQRRRGSSSSRNRGGDICGRLPPKLRRWPSPDTFIFFQRRGIRQPDGEKENQPTALRGLFTFQNHFSNKICIERVN